MPISEEEFRSALRHFAAGVTVVTTRDAADRPSGLTASAFTSVSLEPPLILVCVDRAAVSHPCFEAHGWFAVNVLDHDQTSLSRRFAASGGDKFGDLVYREGLARLPLLDGVVATLECRLVARHEAGDHTIFVGQVERADARGGRPLVYFQGGYHHIAPLAHRAAGGPGIPVTIQSRPASLPSGSPGPTTPIEPLAHRPGAAAEPG